MARRNRRTRKASLRGWGRGLPFLLIGFGVFFSFSWLEAQRLNNEYRANALAQDIRRVKANIDRLRGEQHYLNRMERLEQEASVHDLREPDPGQIAILRITADDFDSSTDPVALRSSEVLEPTASAFFTLAPPRTPRAEKASLLRSIASKVLGREEEAGTEEEEL